MHVFCFRSHATLLVVREFDYSGEYILIYAFIPSGNKMADEKADLMQFAKAAIYDTASRAVEKSGYQLVLCMCAPERGRNYIHIDVLQPLHNSPLNIIPRRIANERLEQKNAHTER